MTILHINKFFYMRGGAERHFFDLMQLQQEHGHTVIPFSMQDTRNRESNYSSYFASNITFDPPNLRTLIKAGRVIYSHEVYKKVKKLIQETQPDIAHVHNMYHQLSPAVLLALNNANIPIVFTAHDWQVLNPNYKLATPNHIYSVEEGKKYWHIVTERAIKHSYLMSFLAAAAATLHRRWGWYTKSIDAIITPSQFGKQLFLNYGWTKDKLHYIPHFIETPQTPPQVDKKPYILYAGRLSWEKGIDKLVQYWGEQKLPYTLRIAGTGPLQKKIKNIIQQYQLEDRVILLGFLEKEELEKKMQQAAALIVPSAWYEVFGLTVHRGVGTRHCCYCQ